MFYSNSTERVFCAPCKLYGVTSALVTYGFNNWINSYIINDDDINTEHRECLIKYINRSNISQRVDHDLMTRCQKDVNYRILL